MIIYKVLNKINGKIYIGQTTRTLDKRKEEHINSKDDSFFHQALRKYGNDNFEWEIIFECNNLSTLNEQEIFYINKYNSYKKGYNMSLGGEFIPMIEPNIAKKQGNSVRGKNHHFYGKKRPDHSKWMKENNPAKKEEVRIKLSSSKIGDKNPNYGKKIIFSEERNRKISNSRKGIVFSKETREKMSITAKRNFYKRKRDCNGMFVSGE